VLDRANQPLGGVTITVLGHPEFGETLSRADGMFDMAVNGGGQLTMTYEKTGFLPAQRAVDAPWRDFAWAPDVVLVSLDTAVTTIDLTGGTMQTARGNPATDADGTRRATVLFPGGTAANLVMPNGSTQPISTLHIRATEFTVGDSGPKAMPAPLPPSSGYTYAVELSADEAIAAGARSMDFSQPLPVYVENFLGFPVGGGVPTGYYDRDKGQWIASADGRVIKILSITGGAADLDITGDDVADDASVLGVTAAERTRLGTLYSVGQSLWRVPVQHFTPWDMNWPYGPPADALNPPTSDLDQLRREDNPHKECGSVIGCEDQSLGESLPVAGTSFQLNYQSTRAPGYKNLYAIDVRVSDATALPPTLLGMRAAVTVGGRLYQQTFAPAPNINWSVPWDGLDAYGRRMQGSQQAHVKVSYDYQPQYYGTSGALFNGSFARVEAVGASVSGSKHAGVVTLNREWSTFVGGWQATADGLGGWSLSVHHTYDPVARVLLLGDGSQRAAQTRSGNLGNVLSGSPYSVPALVVAPDGSIYFIDTTDSLGFSYVRRIGTDGVISTIAGGQDGFSGDGGPATAARVRRPQGIAIGPDGSIYISDQGNYRVRRIGTDGIISTVAGNGSSSVSGDGGPATAAAIGLPFGIDVGSDGSLFIADGQGNRIRRVGADGIITTFAGTGDGGFSGDGGPAVNAQLASPRGVAVADDGTLYIADYTSNRIRRVSPSGIITTFAGNGLIGGDGDGGPATAARMYQPNSVAVGEDGNIFIADTGGSRVRVVAPSGVINTMAGKGPRPFGDLELGTGGPATSAYVDKPLDVAVAPDGTLYVATIGSGSIPLNRQDVGIRKVVPAFPGTSLSDILLASEDGRELFVFNAAGRHLRTLDALTGGVRFEFGYDGAGALTSITDGSSNVTVIERTGGVATAIVAPGGQRTALSVNADGWLTSAVNPASEASTMSYSTDGLLQTFTDPLLGGHSFTYDGSGRLTKDEGPGGTFTSLSRAAQSNGYTVTTTTALGRAATYKVQYLPNGSVRRTSTEPSGEVTVTTLGTDGTEVSTFGNGGTATVQYGPDPRWGMLAPVAKSVVMTTPGGITRTITGAVTATLSNPTNLLSLASLTETSTESGQTRTRTYNAATRTFTFTSPEGRTSTATIDALGRWTSYAPSPGIAPLTYAYDTHGRLSLEAQGAESAAYAYDSLNRVASVTDGAGSATTYAYDAADRVTSVTFPGGRQYQYAYDANGETTSITMPNGAVHSLGYTARGEQASYDPPGGAAGTDWAYSADRALTDVTLGGGRTISETYDAGGRPIGQSFPEASIAYGYSDLTNRMATMSRTPSSGQAQSVGATYDAELVKTLSFTGAAQGSYAYTYDARARLSAMNLTSGADVVNLTLARDNDGLITQYGPFAVTRGPGEMVASVGDGVMSQADTYDANGRMTRRRQVVNGTTAYQMDFTFDAAGRLSQRTDTTSGGAHTFVYAYNAFGDLASVTRDGIAVEAYSYDANGNRSTTGAPATYDTRDRLTSLGGTTYTYDADGFLTSRGADTFAYSASGELVSATAGGQPATYSYDALGRRVNRKQGGDTTEYLYGNPANPLQVTASRDAAGLTAYFYAENNLVAMSRAGVRYYIAADQVGSPRVVTDATGAVVKAVEYDAYGRVLSDSNPAFVLALGYAGGIADGATGLVHFGFRDYEPASGRWTAADPGLFENTLNLYAYAANDPVNGRDPNGLWAVSIGFTAYEGLGGGASLTIGGTGLNLTGFKVCGEVGVGIGGGLEAGVAHDVGSTDLKASVLLDASATVGLVKVGGGVEYSRKQGDPCRKLEGKVSVGLKGVAEASLNFDKNGPKGFKEKVGLKELGLSTMDSPEIGGVKLGAKLAAKACGGAGH
jgi:RHS repeat-associated protein